MFLTNAPPQLQESANIAHVGKDGSNNHSTSQHFHGESFIFGSPTTSLSYLLHPDTIQIFCLWQICLENVNSLVRLFHVPTMQQLIIEASSNLVHISPGMEALMFAIYLSAVMSLQEDECQKLMGEPAPVLIQRFSLSTQQALVNARFLKSVDIFTLQAFVLFLVSLGL